MSAYIVQPPFEIFTDIDGQPLESGFVWLGVANLDPQTNPIAAFWDEALTIPAPQPLRTSGGYIFNSGTPARIFVGANSYSIRVMNKNGSQLYTLLNATSIDLNASGIDLNASGIEYMPAGTGAVATTVQAKLRESVSVKDFGAATTNTASQNAAAFALAAAAVPTDGTLFFPDGTYQYSGGLVFSRPVTLTGSAGAILDYTGTGKALQLGPTGITTIENADYGNYEIEGLKFIGGASMTHGIYVPSWVLFPKIKNTQFYRFGNSTAYAIFCQGMNWQVLVSTIKFMNDQVAPRNFLRTDGYADGLGADFGNSHLTIVDSNISSTSGISIGVGIAHTGAADIITGNKIEGFAPNIRSGFSANSSIISKNYFEVITGNCIEFGDVTGGYQPSAFVTGLTIIDNYCNMHATDGNGNTGSFVAPSNPLTGLKFSKVKDNKLSNASQVVPIVKLNNLASQIGNLGSGNTDLVNLAPLPLRTIASNTTAWLGEPVQALGLVAGVSSLETPQVAGSYLDTGGVVHLSGRIKATSSSIPPNSLLAFLPAGYFPSGGVIVPVYEVGTLAVTYLVISVSGGISCGITLASTSLLDMNGVSFNTKGP